MLIGPKGSGKTYMGTLVGAKTHIAFLRIETIWLALKPDEDGWQQVELAIDRAFARTDDLMIESLGAGRRFHQLLASLTTRYSVRMIRVVADLDTCLARVKKRRGEGHIPVSDDKVEEYNRIASKVQFDWSLEIDNNGPALDAEILDAFRSILY